MEKTQIEVYRIAELKKYIEHGNNTIPEAISRLEITRNKIVKVRSQLLT